MPVELSEKRRAFLQGAAFLPSWPPINKNGSPQLTTIWYLLDGDTIVMNTKVGRTKERNMRRTSHIGLLRGWIQLSHGERNC